MELRQYFDRVVLINLPRRPHRLAQAKAALRQCGWPFREPEIFAAIDGAVVAPPGSWKSSPGAWGCLQSHRLILEDAIRNGVKSILVLEDDVCFIEGFENKIEEFLRVVPEDWDQLMIGGQHVNLTGQPPILVKPGVYRCTDCERTHCYSVRGEYMRILCQRWAGGGKYDGRVHCDWIMGRDPEMQLAHKVYAPETFLVGQDTAESDVNPGLHLRQFWNPPKADLPIINLHAPAPVAATLRQCGFYFGRDCDPAIGADKKLERIFLSTLNDHSKRERRLALWIRDRQWDVASNPDLVCIVWHPQATPELVKAASSWPVYEITASSHDEAIRQLPSEWANSRVNALRASKLKAD